LRSWIIPIALVILGLGFALVPLAQGRMFFYWDNAQQHYPQTVFLQQGLQQGAIPHWWPEVGMGFPTMAEGQSAYYHPIRLLTAFVFSAPASLMWELALYFAIAGLSTYFFLREFRLHRTACFLGAATQMFCSFAVVYVRNVALHRSFFLLPLALLCAERFVRRGSVRSLLAAVVVIGTQFLAGHPSFAIVTVVATFVYLVVRSLQHGARRGDVLTAVGRALGTRLGAWACVVVLSLGLAAVQVVPTLMHARQSQRDGGLTFEYATGSQPATPRGLGQLLFPYIYTQGDWLPTAEFWGRFNNVPGNGMYAGVLCIVLAPVALWWRRRWPDPALPLAVSGIVAIGFALGAKAPFFPAWWSLPGMNSLRFPSRFLYWAAFCLSCLAAFGAHRLIAIGRLNLPQVRRLAPIGLVALALVALGGALMAGLPGARDGVVRSLIWYAAAVLIAALVTTLKGRLQSVVLLLAVFLAVGDLWAFRAHGNYARTVPIEEAVSPPGHVGYLKGDPERFRVLSLIVTEKENPTTEELKEYVQADLSTIWGIESADVFLSLFLKRYFAVRQSVAQEILQRPESARSLASFLGALNVKYIVAPENVSLSGWQRVYAAGQTVIWKNPSVLPRAFLVGSVRPQVFELTQEWRLRGNERLADYQRTVSDWFSREVDVQIIDHVMASQVDYASAAEVAGAENIHVSPLAGASTVQILASGPDEMRFSVDTSTPAFLVMSSNFYPGWTATVNGQAATLFQTNWVMTGLPVPAGKSEVVLRFRTPGFGTGLMVSALVALLVMSMLFLTAPLKRVLSSGRSTSAGA
jgi:hypothetical protein